MKPFMNLKYFIYLFGIYRQLALDTLWYKTQY